MKLACLFSGGKDSNFALHEASKEHEVVCLISLKSKNLESYMFQTQGIDFVKYQAEALGLPLHVQDTLGEKEFELEDLKKAFLSVKEEYGVEGIVTGAINSIYQSSRIQRICDEVGLWCFNPLWQKDQIDFLHELAENGFEVVIVGVASYPFDESFLGGVIDEKMIKKLVEFNKKYEVNPAGEGGELETFVVDSPLFKKKIVIEKSSKVYSNYSGVLNIEKVSLKRK